MISTVHKCTIILSKSRRENSSPKRLRKIEKSKDFNPISI